MKTRMKIIAIATMLLANVQIFAQHKKEIKNSEVEGFYITALDFKNGKITFPIDKAHKGDKIKLKQFFISPEIISIEQNEETVFYKDSIFTIRLSNGENYRFINRTPYLVADTSSLYIYTLKTTKTEFKNSGPRTRIKEVPITYYYFSLANHKDVYRLTLANLRKYVLTEPKLHFSVCNKFTNDAMLRTINNQTGRFELNETILSVLNK
jgi:hypothetical protein